MEQDVADEADAAADTGLVDLLWYCRQMEIRLRVAPSPRYAQNSPSLIQDTDL